MRTKKIISAIALTTAAVLTALPLAACGNSGNPAAPENKDAYDIPQDYCRTYYEIFLGSFADGDGDGMGDIRGLINNLDYLNDGNDSTTADLGINGIWLMPIHPSPTYHKYDVRDYMDIDPDYGTLEDFDELVTECNKRGIWLQMDLVLNHTSSKHEWFLEACRDARAGKTPEQSEAMRRYCFVPTDERPSTGKYYTVSGTSYSYLANFDSGMPDLNLAESETNGLRDEIKIIVDFWLENGVKSFRLDAVPWACADSVSYNEENGKFWTWFNDYCNEKGADVAADFGWSNDDIPRYCYNVGEVFGNNGAIPDFFGTGMSNFNYAMGSEADSGFPGAANGIRSAYRHVEILEGIQKGVLAKDENAILSNFLSNHDNNRSAGYMEFDPAKIKAAAALYLLAPGNPYIYYGEELGAAGSGRDENKRLSFNWGDKQKGITYGPSAADYTGEQKLGTWNSQNTDKNSVLTYYRQAIMLRNRFPEIGRGVLTAYGVNGEGKIAKQSEITSGGTLMIDANALNKTVAAYTLTWKDRTVLIVHNLGGTDATVDVSAFADMNLVGSLKASGGAVSLGGSALKMSGRTVAVLK